MAVQSVKVRQVEFGKGRPKICIPMVGKNEDELLDEAKLVNDLECDCVEWRVDFFDQVDDVERVKAVGRKIRHRIPDRPILFTFRTFREGGAREFSSTSYFSLYTSMIEMNMIDMLDIELFMDRSDVCKMMDFAHTHGVKVVMCNHDFEKTPNTDELISRLITMQELGADICKIAVMPHTSDDVLRLLYATNTFSSEHAKCPVISMSMGDLGVVSRLTGELFGSCMTFGAAEKASAPGQIPVNELNAQLDFFHRYFAGK